jgi:transposase/YHS domain-containing protein
MHNEELIAKVKQLYEKHKNYHKVARILSESYTSVRFMVLNDYSKPKAKRGPKQKISPREKTRIKREIRKLSGEGERVTAKKLKDTLQIKASLRTIQRNAKRQGFKYQKAVKKINLSPSHKKRRLELAKQWLRDSHPWNRTVFTDEKRFSLDGPDDWRSYSDQKNPPKRQKRQMKGGSIMIWGMVLPDGFLWIKKVDGRQKSSNYVSLLKNEVKPFLENYYEGKNYYFQQDNCSIHVSKESIKWIEANFNHVISWPAKSPDLNIIENVWNSMEKIVYDGKQYTSKEELWTAIQNAAEVIMAEKRDLIRKYFANYNERLIEVIEKKGDLTKY